jgi:hypothetical protein
MITDEEKIRIKTFLFSRGIVCEFIGANHLAVLFGSLDPHRQTVPKFWRWYYRMGEEFRHLIAEDSTGAEYRVAAIDHPVKLYQTLDEAIRSIFRNTTFKS